ncbi:MAG TPA: glycerol-3-phosphate 1-O-acyltransferase PlsY [Armatimonadota bacterium]|nr:glycerol-3-phosphate 1-O-acyltransferase PlsY [Armatimonadota bacterium]
MKEAAVLVISYLLGAVPIGLIIGKVTRGVDIRQYGSGNIGATNVLRTLGWGLASMVFIGDTLKGLIAVLLAVKLTSGAYQPYYVIGAGLLSVVGHSASPFLGFKGGKGVATSLGVIIGMNWLIAAIAFSAWVLIVAVTRYVSVASILASLSVPVMMFFSKGLFGQPVPREYTVCALAAAFLILLRHRANIKRLVKGNEPRFGQKVKIEEESKQAEDKGE